MPVLPKPKKRPQYQRFATRYPWEEWFAKRRFTIRRGIDYHCRTYSMDQIVRNAAGPRRYNVKVSIEVAEDGNSLTVFVLPRNVR